MAESVVHSSSAAPARPAEVHVVRKPTAKSQKQSSGGNSSSRQDPTRKLFVGLARGFGGAIFFSLPLLMTMEMWWLGFYIDPLRLALFMTLMIPLLIGLDHFSGFKETSTWMEDVLDGITAYGVGFLASAVVLLLFDVVDLGSMPLREVVGKISLQAVPASFGAVLANSQLVDRSNGNQEQQAKQREDRRKEDAGYGGELFFMTTGAVFLAFNLAPTEEMVLIAFKMSHWHHIALAVASLLLMHAFVYSVSFKGTHSAPEGSTWWGLFLRFTVVGYALALVLSAYILWTFGRYEDSALSTYVAEAIVLGFPAALGASAARLIL